MEPYSHRWSLPRWLSKSGLKPSRGARLRFVLIGTGFLLLLANSAVAAATEGQMYPGVAIGHHNVGWKTQQQARSTIESAPQSYELSFAIGGQTITTTTAHIGASFDLDKTIALAYRQARSPVALLGLVQAAKNRNVSYVYQLNNAQLSRFTNLVITQVGHPPVNATLKVVDGVLQTVPDADGLGINAATLQRVIGQSLAASASQTIHLNPEPVKAAVQTIDLPPARTQAQQLLSRTITLTYNGQNYTATPTNIGYWLSFTPQLTSGQPPQLKVSLDRTQIKGWVQSVANQINVNPVNKKVTIANGVSTVDQQGQDGLAVDQDKTTDAIMAAMQANQNLISYAVPTSSVAFKTITNQTVALGFDKYIEVNLSSQHLWAYDHGQVVESSPVTSGATGAGFPTVTGLFHIYYKTTDTFLNGHPYGYNYNVFVQYWMPFYLGYGLHDASWRSSFGGSDYYWGGSHGCVNLPTATAAFLYNWSEVGTPVWVHT